MAGTVSKDTLVLGACLGNGTVADVYAGAFLGTEVAVKVLRRRSEITERSTAERAEDDFTREAEILQGLRHPNIILYLGPYVLNDGRRCLIMERCPGGVLDVEVLNVRSVELWHLLRIAKEIALAMAYAQCHGIVHRDLKPSNILLDSPATMGTKNLEPSQCRPKVADWGLARPLPRGSEDVMTGSTGTYEWMAPEVIAKDKYGPECDVYSFAIVLWNLAASRKNPYPLLTPAQAALGVVKHQTRPDVASVSRNTPEGYISLMRRCWSHVPEDRPNFEECALRLSQLQGEQQIGSKSPSSGGWFW